MSPLAELFRIRRAGDRPLRTLGGRMDDAGPVVALPSLGYGRARFRSDVAAGGRMLVLSLALRTLARRQRPGSACSIRMRGRPTLGSDAVVFAGGLASGGREIRKLPGRQIRAERWSARLGRKGKGCGQRDGDQYANHLEWPAWPPQAPPHMLSSSGPQATLHTHRR